MITVTPAKPAVLILALTTVFCAAKITSHPFGKTPDGEQVDLYTLTDGKGAQATISTYGGVVVSLSVPDRNGRAGDVVLGFDGFSGYLKPPPYFGAIVGRYANRIGHAMFTLDGITYTLAKNDGDNSLHGGLRGFDKRIWKVNSSGPGRLELSYLSKDGEEGFPGNLATVVTYTLKNHELRIDYFATTDKPTVVNLTNHSYFNLAGQGEGNVLGHVLTVNADRFTPVDKTMIPTGELRSVEGTPLDFRKPHTIGERIDSTDEQIALGHGYDQNFVINRTSAGLEFAAKVLEPGTGRVLEVLTTEPGVQLYTANYLDGTITGKNGKVYGRRAAFCLETQHFPDSPNKPAFPSVVLRPGGHYQTSTVYRFSVESPAR